MGDGLKRAHAAAKRSRDHVVAHDGTQGDMAMALECLHCKTVQKMALPCSINVWVAAARAFGKEHARCKKP